MMSFLTGPAGFFYSILISVFRPSVAAASAAAAAAAALFYVIAGETVSVIDVADC